MKALNFTRDAIVLIALCCVHHSAVAQIDDDVEQAQALCKWAGTIHPGGQPPKPTFCGHLSNFTPLDLSNRTSDWWNSWPNPNSDAASAAREQFGLWLENYRSEKIEAAETAARIAKLRPRLKSLPDRQLCLEYGLDHLSIVAKEIERRHLFPDSEWALIKNHKIHIGMSELGLLCSWGEGDVNRTITEGGEEDQHVYGDQYVYVKDGRIIAFQD